LKELEKEGFILKESNITDKIISVNYLLTPKANSLLNMVPGFCLWGDQYLDR
jgi:DNA-binding HxlR family transcriptional regulator